MVRRSRGGLGRRNVLAATIPSQLPKTRVAWLCTYRVPFSGGLATHVRAWIGQLDRDRFDPIFFGWGETQAIREFLAAGGNVTFVDLRELRYYPWSYPIAVLHVAWCLRRQRVHVVHSAQPPNDMLALAAGIIARVPVLICSIEGALMPTWISKVKRSLYYLGYQLALPHIDHLVSLSSAAASDAANFLGIDRDQIAVIYPGVASTEPVVTSRDSSALSVGTISRLDRDKPVELFLDAAARLQRTNPDLTYVIAGDGPRRDELERLAKALGIGVHVRFLGHVDPMSALRQMDIFSFCSFNEGLGYVILEAMSVGLPVVSMRAGGIPEAVEHGVTGYLVPPGAIPEFVAALRLLVDDPDLRQRMGRAGQHRVRQMFSLHNEIQAFARLYSGWLRPELNSPHSGPGL